MTSVGQDVNIILEGNCIEISTQNYAVAIRGHLQKIGSLMSRMLQTAGQSKKWIFYSQDLVLNR
jgi:hypothetical protein